MTNPTLREPTAFERRVYDLVKRIPSGRVSTYSIVASRIGCGSPRAVGQALRRNPYAPTVPCHRVIASDLSVGGFSGATTGRHIDRKLRLLRREGVLFDNGRLASSGMLYRFDGGDHRP